MTHTDVRDESFCWSLVILWAVATSVGWLLGHPLVDVLAVDTLRIWSAFLLTGVAAVTLVQALQRKRKGAEPHWSRIPINTGWGVVAAIGLLGIASSIAGVLQWTVLRRYIAISPWWFFWTNLGAWIFVRVEAIVVGSDVYFYYALNGVLIGLMQWLVLRRHAPAAGWWIAASTVAWPAGLAGEVAFVTFLDNPLKGFGEEAALVFDHSAPNLIGGLVCGGITGITLAALFRKKLAST